MRIDGALPLPENVQTQKAANSGSSASPSRPASIDQAGNRRNCLLITKRCSS